MPTTPIATYGAARVDPLKYGDDAVVQHVNLKASTVYSAGTVLGEVTASPGTYGTYASGNVDGTQLASMILQYACQTDASGNITLGTGTAGQEWGQTSKSAPAYLPNRQVWNCADLPNLDTNAITVMRGVLVRGTAASGEVIL